MEKSRKVVDNLIYGRNPVKEAIKSHRVLKVYISEGFQDQKMLEEIKANNVICKTVNNGFLNSQCDGNHQGIAAEIKPYEYHSLEEIIARSKKIDRPIIVLLDGINDPHNLGAIIRSCEIFNVSGVVIPKHNQVGVTSTTWKTSAGAINYVPVAQVTNLNSAIKTLKDNGYWVVSTAGSATMNYHELKYDFPTVLVIGNEGSGVSSLVLKNSDFIVKIPMHGQVNSLNASVAAGILLSRIRNS